MPFVTFLVLSIAPFASAFGSAALMGRKNAGRRATVAAVLLSVFLPPVGILVSLATPRQAVRGRTPEEQAANDKLFQIDNLKAERERMQGRIDRLSMSRERSAAYRVTHPGEWFPAYRMREAQRRIDQITADLRGEYEFLGRLQRRAERSMEDRFMSVRVRRTLLPDGTELTRFLLPYDIGRDAEREIRGMLAKRYGIDPDNPAAVLRGEHRASDRKGYAPDTTLLIFDRIEHELSAFGNRLTEEQESLVVEAGRGMEEAMSECGLDPESDVALSSMMRITPLGEEAVALSVGNVLIAYAVAGRDGQVRMMGSGVSPQDRGGMRLASGVNERLKGCADLSSWIREAGRIVASPANMRLGIEAGRREESFRARLERKRAVRNAIVDAPSKTLKGVAGGLKIG
jgi:hypothetical protein